MAYGEDVPPRNGKKMKEVKAPSPPPIDRFDQRVYN